MEEELNKRADEKEVTLKEFLENQETVSEESSLFLHKIKIQIFLTIIYTALPALVDTSKIRSVQKYTFSVPLPA